MPRAVLCWLRALGQTSGRICAAGGQGKRVSVPSVPLKFRASLNLQQMRMLVEALGAPKRIPLLLPAARRAWKRENPDLC